MSKERINISAARKDLPKQTPLSRINRDHMIKEIFDLYTRSVTLLRGKSLTKDEADYLYAGLYHAVQAIEIAERY
jgi:hypothetical protein